MFNLFKKKVKEPAASERKQLGATIHGSIIYDMKAKALTIKHLSEATGKRSVVIIDWDTGQSVMKELNVTDHREWYQAAASRLLEQLEQPPTTTGEVI